MRYFNNVIESSETTYGMGQGRGSALRSYALRNVEIYNVSFGMAKLVK